MNNLQQTQIATRRDRRVIVMQMMKIIKSLKAAGIEVGVSNEFADLYARQKSAPFPAWATELIKNEEGSLDNSDQISGIHGFAVKIDEILILATRLKTSIEETAIDANGFLKAQKEKEERLNQLQQAINNFYAN